MQHLFEIDEEEYHDRQEILFLEGVIRRLPQHTPALKSLGDLYTRAGRCEDGLKIDRLLAELCPDEDTVWYNLACSFALTGEPDAAFDALEKAVKLGYDDDDWMESDPDLDALHGFSRFNELLQTIRKGSKPD